MIELKVESGKYGQIVLIIENLSEVIITLKYITLLWSVNFFDYKEISNIGPSEGQLYPGKILNLLRNYREISFTDLRYSYRIERYTYNGRGNCPLND